jgi:hypothetical protein
VKNGQNKLRNQEHRNTNATSKLIWNYCAPCMKAIDHTNKKGFSRMMNPAKKAFFWSVLVLSTTATTTSGGAVFFSCIP